MGGLISQAVTAELDVRVFLRVPKQLLQTRREGRSYLLEGELLTQTPAALAFQLIAVPHDE